MELKINKKGFSLVELLVVITIIAILSVTAYIALSGQTAKARNSKRMEDMATLHSALELYAISNDNKYPENQAALEGALVPDYISKILTDPAKTDTYSYVYTTSGVSNPRSFQLSATLEDEDGGTAHKAYAIGKYTPSANNGYTWIAGSENCGGADSCIIDDGDTDCLPYCL